MMFLMCVEKTKLCSLAKTRYKQLKMTISRQKQEGRGIEMRKSFSKNKTESIWLEGVGLQQGAQQRKWDRYVKHCRSEQKRYIDRKLIQWVDGCF
jgi:hypothetical protein